MSNNGYEWGSDQAIGLKLRVAHSQQLQFQLMCGIDFTKLTDLERDTVAETYLFKAVEEIIELRKEQPSGLNRFSKNQPVIDREKMVNELVDVHFFLMNFMLSRDITFGELIQRMEAVQSNNFEKLQRKLELNENNLKEQKTL